MLLFHCWSGKLCISTVNNLNLARFPQPFVGTDVSCECPTRNESAMSDEDAEATSLLRAMMGIRQMYGGGV